VKRAWRVVVVVVGLCALSACAPENEVPGELAHAGDGQAPPPVVLLQVEPGAVIFPRSVVGRATSTSVRIRNAGEALAQVELRIPPPFTVKNSTLNLPPGGEHAVELSLTPTAPGLTGGVLSVRSGGRTIEITVRAEVEAAPTGP
jgi:hypothetical protein